MVSVSKILKKKRGLTYTDILTSNTQGVRHPFYYLMSHNTEVSDTNTKVSDTVVVGHLGGDTLNTEHPKGIIRTRNHSGELWNGLG